MKYLKNLVSTLSLIDRQYTVSTASPHNRANMDWGGLGWMLSTRFGLSGVLFTYCTCGYYDAQSNRY